MWVCSESSIYNLSDISASLWSWAVYLVFALHKKHKRTEKKDELKGGKMSSSKINGLFFNTGEKGRKGDQEDRSLWREGKLMPTDRHQTSDRGPRAASAAAQAGEYISVKLLRDVRRAVWESSGRTERKPCWHAETRRQTSSRKKRMTKIYQG